jgi:hypothetical protein
LNGSRRCLQRLALLLDTRYWNDAGFKSITNIQNDVMF